MPYRIDLIAARRTPRWAAVLVVTAVYAGISGCDTNPAAVPKTTSGGNGAGAPAPAQVELKPGAKTIAQERAGDRPFDKTFDDLRFEMTIGEPFKREMLPEKIESLKDQRIRIRGFILPTAQKRGLKVFVLVRDNQVCCFGPGAALYDCILVEMKPGTTAEYSYTPVTVDGKFDIQEVLGPDGMHLAIYHMTAESVE